MHQKVAHISRLVFFLVFTVGVLLLSHTYLHGKNNSPQTAFTLTEPRLDYMVGQWIAILLGLFN